VGGVPGWACSHARQPSQPLASGEPGVGGRSLRCHSGARRSKIQPLPLLADGECLACCCECAVRERTSASLSSLSLSPSSRGSSRAAAATRRAAAAARRRNRFALRCCRSMARPRFKSRPNSSTAPAALPVPPACHNATLPPSVATPLAYVAGRSKMNTRSTGTPARDIHLRRRRCRCRCRCRCLGAAGAHERGRHGGVHHARLVGHPASS
jgi:hypothetical protein